MKVLYFIIFIFLCFFSFTQELENKEILYWWGLQTEEQQIEHLRKYITIINTEPNIVFPESIFILDEAGTAYINFQTPLQLFINDNYLSYNITIPDLKYENVADFSDYNKFQWKWGIGGFCIGFSLTVVGFGVLVYILNK